MSARNLDRQIRDGDLIAAADIGSNSFHLVVARYAHGELRVVDRLRETIRLAAGLRKDGTLARDRREAAFSCLARFGQRLEGFQSHHVRAVATNTVRQLSNPQTFLLPAETALGHPIEVVSGREEARLIYQGVAHGLPMNDDTRLVIDIGGSSTEFIIGQRYEALERESLQVGCIASSLRFFEDGKITAQRWQRAQAEIGVELQQFVANYRQRGWTEAVGSSGTMKAIGNIAHANGWCEQGISLEAVGKLREYLLRVGRIDALDIAGLSRERVGVITGGVAILDAIFSTFQLRQLTVCETAMREGLLYDMLGRAQHTDSRNTSIDALAERYGIDAAQALRVARTASALFVQVADAWQLDNHAEAILRWCAEIHEIGLAIAHSQHHLHAAYIVANSDLAGFGRQEQAQLACIVRCHRRKPEQASLRALPERMRGTTRHLIALLRLAVLLNRSRRDGPLPPLRVLAQGTDLTLEIAAAWLEHHSLARVDLEQERSFLKAIDINLQIVKRSDCKAVA